MIEQKALAVGGFILGMFLDLIGGWDITIYYLFIFVTLDFLFGVGAAAVGVSPKTTTGKISSEAMRNGIVRKCAIIGIVIVAEGVDVILEIDYLRNGLVLAFIACEVTSILEHAMNLGLSKHLGKYGEIFKNLFDVKQK